MTQTEFDLRLATAADAAAFQAIYAPIVRDTVISFEVEPPGVAEMQQRITTILATHPWLVAVRGAEILGYAYGSQHRNRAAYQWSADVSVYVHRDARRLGVGRRLYQALLAALREQGFWQAFAGITLPNAASVALHESVGFLPLGVYRSVGFKSGAWRDVGWWQRPLQPEAGGAPAPLRPLMALVGSPRWPELLAQVR